MSADAHNDEQEPYTVSPIDVLAQCAVAMQYTASAMLSAITLCQQSGQFGSNDVKAAVSEAEQELKHVVERVNRRSSRAVFMKREPAGSPQAPQQPTQ